MIERVGSLDDPRLAEYRHVPEPELVRRRGVFVAEGRLVLKRVLECGSYQIRSILLNEAAHRALEPILPAVDSGVPIYICDSRDFGRLTGFDIHRGCLAIVERPPALTLDQVMAGARLIVGLESVANADNVGGVFRNAAAFGVDAVVLSPGSCDPFYRKAIRTSMGAALRVPFARADDWPAALVSLRRGGFTLAALTPREPSEPLETRSFVPRSEKLALLVGTEGQGLSPSTESTADVRVRIPIRPDVDSLNLAVATGIALYRLTCSH